MIDFSQYPEHNTFRVPVPTLEDPGSRVPDFREAFFELRRVQYIDYIEDRTTALSELLSQVIASGTGPGGAATSGAIDMLGILKTISPSVLFRVQQPKALSANCLGTDYAYDAFRDFLGISSQVEGLSRYDGTFVFVLDDVFSVLNQVFNQIGTRGQLYGYIDQEVITLCDYIDTLITNIENSTTWASALTVINGANLQLALETFRDNVVLAASDMRLLIEPVVKYLNLMLQASNALTHSWGSYALSPELQLIVNRFNVAVPEYAEDYFISDAGSISQIFEQIRTFIKDDNSNFELMVMKSSRMAFDEIDITGDLNQVASEIIIPNYNP